MTATLKKLFTLRPPVPSMFPPPPRGHFLADPDEIAAAVEEARHRRRGERVSRSSGIVQPSLEDVRRLA